MILPRSAALALTVLVLSACNVSVPGGAQVSGPGVTVLIGPSGERVEIPAGHLPPPGSCRVWYPDRPAGQQPPPTSCNTYVPPGAVLVGN